MKMIRFFLLLLSLFVMNQISAVQEHWLPRGVIRPVQNEPQRHQLPNPKNHIIITDNPYVIAGGSSIFALRALVQWITFQPNYYRDDKPDRQRVELKDFAAGPVLIGNEHKEATLSYPELLNQQELPDHIEFIRTHRLSDELKEYYLNQYLLWFNGEDSENFIVGLLQNGAGQEKLQHLRKQAGEIAKKVHPVRREVDKQRVLEKIQKFEGKLEELATQKQAQDQAERIQKHKDHVAAQQAAKNKELRDYVASLQEKVKRRTEYGEDCSVQEQRLLAIGDLNQNAPIGLVQGINLTPEVKALFQEVGTEIEKFDLGKGNCVQIQLQKEVIAQAQGLFSTSLSKKDILHVFDILIQALDHAQQGELVKGFKLLDFATRITKRLLELDKAIVEGVFQGVENIARPFLHPVQTAHDLKEFASLITTAMADIRELNYLTATNSPQALQKAQEISDKFDFMVSHLTAQMKEMSLDDWLCQTASLGTEFMAPASLPKITKSLGKLAQESGVIAKLAEIQKSERLARAMEALIQEAKAAQAGFLRIAKEKEIFASTATQRINSAIRASGFEERLELLRKRFDGALVGMKQHGMLAGKKIEIPYRHVLHPDIEGKMKTIGMKERFTGFHHDHLGFWEKNGLLDIRNKVMGPHGTYKLDIFFNGKEYPKTFFPQHWDDIKVVEKVREAFENSVVEKIKYDGAHFLRGATTEGIEIRMIVDKEGIMSTAYPLHEGLTL